MVVMSGYTAMKEGDWFEWVYLAANPWLEVGGILRNVQGPHLELEELHVFPRHGVTLPENRDLSEIKKEFFKELLLSGYTSVTINGTRIKEGKPTRPFQLTVRLLELS